MEEKKAKQRPGWLSLLYNPDRYKDAGITETSAGEGKPENHFTLQKIGDQKTNTTQTTANTVAVNPTFEKRIRDVIAGAKKIGCDEFMAVFSSLHEDVADEGTCFRVAIKTVAKTEKLTSAQIVAAVIERLQIVEEDKKCFESDIEGEAQTRISEKNDEATEIESQIAIKTADLSNLQKEIENLTQKKSAAMQEVGLIEEKKSKRLAEYNLVYESHKTGLEELKEKLELYSKGGK